MSKDRDASCSPASVPGRLVSVVGWQGGQNHWLALQMTGTVSSEKLFTGLPRNGALNSQGTECLRSKRGDTLFGCQEPCLAPDQVFSGP